MGQGSRRGRGQAPDHGRPWRLWEEVRILFQVIQEAIGGVQAEECVLFSLTANKHTKLVKLRSKLKAK